MSGAYDPIEEVEDCVLRVTPDVIQNLQILLAAMKFTELPGTDIEEERTRLDENANALLSRIIGLIEANPSKKWLLQQFQAILIDIENEDTEAREQFGVFLESIMMIFGVESSDGVLDYYL